MVYEQRMHVVIAFQNPNVSLNMASPYFLADVHVLFEPNDSFPGYHAAGWTGNFPLLADLPLPLVLGICWGEERRGEGRCDTQPETRTAGTVQQRAALCYSPAGILQS